MDTNGNCMVTPEPDAGGPRRSLWKAPALFAAFALLVVLLCDRFVEGWNWQPRGFVLFATLVFVAGLAYELVTRNVDAVAYRAAVVIALVAGFLDVWMNFVQLADGVDRSAFLFLGVPLVALLGAAAARFRPEGMSRALVITAITQVMVLIFVLLSWNPRAASAVVEPWRPVGLNVLCATLFAVSALLFRRGTRPTPAATAS